MKSIKAFVLMMLSLVLFGCGDSSSPSPTPQTNTLQVTVTEAGAPLANAQVEVDGETKTTDASGSAHYELEDGTYTISVSMAGYEHGTRTVTVAGATVVAEFEMVAEVVDPIAYTVEIEVTDAETSSVLAGAMVAIGDESKMADENGIASFALVSGQYTASVSKEGYDAASVQFIVAEADRNVDVALMAEATYALTVSVTEAETGADVADAQVTIAGETLMTDSLGDVVFELANGEYAVNVSRDGYQDANSNVTIANAAQTLDLVLSPDVVDNNLYIYHSSQAPNSTLTTWDTWGSGAVIDDFDTYLDLTTTGDWGAVAWGIGEEPAVDVTGFTHAKFKARSADFTEIKVSMQSVTEGEVAPIIAIASGTDLGDGWFEISVELPAFTDMNWFGLVVTGQGLIQIADVYFTTEAAPPVGSDDLFVYHSTEEANAGLNAWDTWGSGAEIVDNGTHLDVTSTGDWGAIAWGIGDEPPVDVTAFSHAKFKIRSADFTEVKVSMQSVTAGEVAPIVPIASGTDLGDGWFEITVALPEFTDMNWFGLVLTGQGLAQITDVYFTTMEVLISQPSAAAPVPAVSDEEAFVIFSDSLTQDKWISVWNADWWNAPLYSEGSVDGDNYARYEITAGGVEGGVTGLEYGVEGGAVNAGMHTMVNFDMYVESGIRQIQVKLVSEDGEAIYNIIEPAADTWHSFAIPFADMETTAGVLNPANLTMLGIQMWGEAGKALFFDNFYFSGSAGMFDLTVNVMDEADAPIEGATVAVGDIRSVTDAAGVAVLTLPEGDQAISISKEGLAAELVVHNLTAADSIDVTLFPLQPAPTEAAPAPTVADGDVFTLFSDALTVDKPISVWWEGWYQPPVYSEISIDGDNTASWQLIPTADKWSAVGLVIEENVDVSDKTGLHLDVYVTAGVTRLELKVVSTGGDAVYNFHAPVTEGWNSFELDFAARDNAEAAFNPADVHRIGLGISGSSRDSVYIDNIYFY